MLFLTIACDEREAFAQVGSGCANVSPLPGYATKQSGFEPDVRPDGQVRNQVRNL
jgi:hypothetical protein